MLAQSESSLIQVSTQGDELVVDSRLIAVQLGIEHASVFKSINKYLTQIQQFGHLRFEIDTVTNSVGARNEVRFCYLNENQATLLMSLSKNTQQVIDCKLALVKAFAQAKQVIPQQFDRIKELELQVILANAERDKALAEQKVLDTRRYIVDVLPEAAQQKILGYKVVQLPPEKIQETLLVDDYGKVRATHSGIGITALAAKYGFGKGTKANNQCREWMKSVGIYDEHWDKELVAQYTPKLPRDLLPVLDRAFRNNEGDRQLYLGE